MKIINDAIEQYERDGYAIFRNVIDADLVAEADQHVRWLGAKYPDLRPEHYHHPLMRDDAFWVRLVSDERLLDIAQFFLGPDIACFTSHYICKPQPPGSRCCGIRTVHIGTSIRWTPSPSGSRLIRPPRRTVACG
jgi:hypothetical protein